MSLAHIDNIDHIRTNVDFLLAIQIRYTCRDGPRRNSWYSIGKK
jgi:hypothetical protein